MKRIIIVLIIMISTFMGEKIYINNRELKQNEYITNSVKTEEKVSENILFIPEENEVITEENQIYEIAEKNETEEIVSVEKIEIAISTPKEEKIIEQPNIQIVQEVQEEEVPVQEIIQQVEETEVVETMPEPIQEPEPVTPKCDGSNHGIGVGNSNKWFNSKQEAINYYDEIQKTWGDKWEKFEIDSATYDKNCPYGYEVWTCPFCGKWTINFYYR